MPRRKTNHWFYENGLMIVYNNKELCIKSHEGTSLNGRLRAFHTIEEAKEELEIIKMKHKYKLTKECIKEDNEKRQTILAKQRVRNRIVQQAKSTEQKIGDQARQKERRLKYSESRNNDNKIKREIRQLRTNSCLLYTSPSPRDHPRSRMPSSA